MPLYLTKKPLDKGHVKAGTNMGLFFLLGKSGAPDKAKAHQYFLRIRKKAIPAP
jgi:TPR repeat protein